jgi:hypothetical protein
MPQDRVTVDPELLAAATKPERATTNDEAPPSKPGTYDTTADIEKMTAWLEEHELDTRNGKPWKSTGYRWELESCPFNPDHDRGEAWAAVMPNGAKAAGCRHDSCTWEWSDLRAKVELEPPADEPAPSGTDDDDRPLVDVRNEALAADWLREELGRGKLAGIFRRGDMLVQTPRIGEHGYVPSKDLGLVDAGPAQVRPITTIGVKSLIEARYECWRNVSVQDGGKRKRMRVPAMFPQQSAQSACESARLGEHAPNLKDLHGVTHTPMIRPDGTILHAAGYDAATGFLYLPDRDLEVYRIPDQPTPDLIRICVDFDSHPDCGVPFRQRGRPRHLDRPTVHSDSAAAAGASVPARCDHRDQSRQRQDPARQDHPDHPRRGAAG